MHRVPISLSSTPSQIISYYKTNKVGVRRLSRDRPSDNRNRKAEFLSPLGNLSRFPPENWREKCPSAGGNVEPSNSRVCRAMTVSMSHDRWQSSKQLACLIVATERTKAKLLTKEPKFGITCLCRHLSNYSSVSPSLPPPFCYSSSGLHVFNMRCVCCVCFGKIWPKETSKKQKKV